MRRWRRIETNADGLVATQQRIHNIIAEIFWNPFHWPFQRRAGIAPRKKVIVDEDPDGKDATQQRHLLPVPQRVPRLLKLEDEKLEIISDDFKSGTRERDRLENSPVQSENEAGAGEEKERAALKEDKPDENDELSERNEDRKASPGDGSEEEELDKYLDQSNLAARTVFQPLAFLQGSAGPPRT